MTDEPRSRPDATRPDAPPAPNQRQRPALVYLVILFAAAFVLLLFAYLMQQRNSAEILGNLSELRSSMGNIQSIDQLVEENRTLREKNQALEDTVESMKETIENLTGQVTELDAARRTQNLNLEQMADQLEAQENTLRAMDLFWQLNKAYIIEDYDLCRELIARLRDHKGTDLTSFLPEGSDGSEDSAARRYREIAADVETESNP